MLLLHICASAPLAGIGSATRLCRPYYGVFQQEPKRRWACP